jgi:hypothetical protein
MGEERRRCEDQTERRCKSCHLGSHRTLRAYRVKA